MGAVKKIKNGEWEKNRRDRLNLTFFELSQQLPGHDPSLTLTKVEILNKSIVYIKELKEKNTSLMNDRCSNVLKSELESMKRQVVELRRRNRQLADLLRTADIRLPDRPVRLTPPPRKWQGKLTQPPPPLTDLPDKQMNETISSEKLTIPQSCLGKPPSKNKKKTKSKKQVKSKSTSKMGRKIPDKPELKTVASGSGPLREINNTSTSMSAPPFSRTLTLPCTTISLVLSNPKTNIVTVAKSNILTAPIMATGIQPVLQRNPSLSTLGPGTLIMPDGRIMPVPPATPTVLTAATQIIVNRPATQPAVIVMQNIAAVKPKSQPRPIVPKLKQRDTTKTTFVNKVPIPAISTHNFTAKMAAAVGKNKPPQACRDGKKCKKKLVLSKESTNEKAALVQASKKSDKPVGEHHKNKLCEELKQVQGCDRSTPNFDDLRKPEAVSNSLGVKNTLTEGDVSSSKRKALDQDEHSKRQKLDENLKIREKLNSSKTSQSESVTDDNLKNKEKYPVNGHKSNEQKNFQSVPSEDTGNEKACTPANNEAQVQKSIDLNVENQVIIGSKNNCNENKVVQVIQNDSGSSEEPNILNTNVPKIDNTEKVNLDSAAQLNSNVTHEVDKEKRHISTTQNMLVSLNSMNPVNQTENFDNSAQQNNKSTQIITVKQVENPECPTLRNSKPTQTIKVNQNEKSGSSTIQNNKSTQVMTVNQMENPQNCSTLHISKSTQITTLNQMENQQNGSTLQNGKQQLQMIAVNQNENPDSSAQLNSKADIISTVNQAEKTNSSVQNTKSTLIATVNLTCPETSIDNKTIQIIQQNATGSIEAKKSENTGKKTNPEKSLMQDDSQELTSLFHAEAKLQSCPENIFREADFRDRNLFIPISHSYMDEVRLSLPHSDFSNDLFSSLQVPTGGQHPESISPTAAFLLAFPLVSTSKTSELIPENDAGESQHATPTTILQIGNIDPPGSELYHQTSLMIENNVSSLEDPMKLNKSSEGVKDSESKQLKEVEHFSKLQQLEINELMRNENFARNNYKEKKHFTGLQEQEMFLPCNKKKSSGRICNYPVPPDVLSNFQDKPFEFPTNNVRHNLVQNPTSAQGRQVPSVNNQKKNHVSPDNMINHQNTYNPLAQPYSYDVFPSGNDFSVPNSNYHTTARVGNETSKAIQTSSEFSTIWPSSSVSASTNRPDYSASYCAYPQKPYSNPPNKNLSQKVHQNAYEDQRLKEKSTSANTLPKFSANFHFNSNNRPSQDVHSYPQTNQTENMTYKLEPKTKKQKTNSQRAPVNWMTTPDIRPVLPDPHVAPVLPDVMFQPQKELDFNATPNNTMLSTTSNITPFNIASSVANNPQTFYPNSHFSGIDLQLEFAPFPEITSNKPPKTLATSSSQQNPHHYSWSPSKSSIPLLPHIDNHMIPSTLPTLVGDLALGTTTPSGPIDTFRNLSMPTTPFSLDNPVKKCDAKQESQKPNGKSPEKECFGNAERRNSNRNLPDYCQKTHSHQGTNTTSSFLSVSQLVDQVKSEQSSSRRGGKQTIPSKNNSNIQKRNLSVNQTDKTILNKMPNNVNNYHPPNPISSGMVNQRKPDLHSNYQENQNSGVGFPGAFGNNVGPPPWQNGKPQRSTSHYKGSYSAESLIGDHPGPPSQDHTTELPPFSMANQFPNQYTHPQKPFMDSPIVTSASYSSVDFPHQNMQPLEFHQHQNFNFPSHNAHYPSGPFNPENDYHIGLDPVYNFNSSRNSSCQTSSHGSKDNRNVSNKRNPPSKRREEFSAQPMQFLQSAPPQGYQPSGARTKCPPPQCPTTSSPAHQGTTTLTNFNLSTIFPEINDKRVVQGSNSFHPSASKHGDGSAARLNARSDYPAANFNSSLAPQMQQMGVSGPPHFPQVSFANLAAPPGNFRPH